MIQGRAFAIAQRTPLVLIAGITAAATLAACSTRVSDSATWATGATIAWRDLATDPGIERTIYATTVDGVMVSRPLRVTGAVQGRADPMAFSAEPQPVLVIADGGGVVVSSDLGATWKIVVNLK